MAGEDKDAGQMAPETRSGRWADKLAGIAFRILLVNVAASTIIGAYAALGWPIAFNQAGGGFGGGYELPVLAHLATFLLGVPSLLFAIRSREALRVLPFVGPFIIFMGFVALAHATDPCYTGWLDAGSKLGSTPLCERFEYNEYNIHTRFHLLYHALYPTLVLADLYWLCLRAWQPAVLRFGGPHSE